MRDYDVKSKAYAKVIADSIAVNGKRLITMEIKAPRFILAEINTHRMLSRNSASSRATPVKKRIEMIEQEPVEPFSWGLNKPGMQSGEVLSPEDQEQARAEWHKGRIVALEIAKRLDSLKVHKQLANRVCETYAFNTQVITATEWNNHNFQRNHKDAQPEYQYLAKLIVEAQQASIPEELRVGNWHLPYIREGELERILEANCSSLPISEILKRCSVARCARVSGVNFETGTYDIKKDLDLFDRLVVRDNFTDPKHWSPLEHIATPIGGFEFVKDAQGDCDYCYKAYQNIDRKGTSWSPFVVRFNRYDDGWTPQVCWKCGQGHVTSGNFIGWAQFRKEFADENRDTFTP